MKIINTLLISTALASTALAADYKHFDADQVNDIGGIVRDYLLEHPEILIEVSEKLQYQQQAMQQQQATVALTELRDDIILNAGSPVSGNPDGSITLVEYFDYQCPYCKRQETIIDELIANNPELRVVYKHFPIFGGASDESSRATLAAYYAGYDYAALHNALMSFEGRYAEGDVAKIAESVGITNAQLDNALSDYADAINEELAANYAQAQQVGISGTPALVIGQTNASTTPEFLPGFSEAPAIQPILDQLS